MQDNHISKGNYAYQFRVDVITTIEKLEYKLVLFLTEEEFSDYHCFLEKGEKTNKYHYQCIIWHKKLLTTKQRNLLKAKYFLPQRNKKNAISFTSAKKIVNLTSYCQKDISENNLNISTLTEEQLSKIPKWLTKNALKTKWKQQEQDFCLLHASMDVYGRYPQPLQFAKDIIKEYRDNDKHPPTKYKLYKLQLKYLPTYTINDYLRDIGYLNEYLQ